MMEIRAGDWGVITRCDEDDVDSDGDLYNPEWTMPSHSRRKALPKQFVGQIQSIYNTGHGSYYYEVWCPDYKLSAPYEPHEFKGAFDK